MSKYHYPATLHVPGGDLQVWVPGMDDEEPSERAVWFEASYNMSHGITTEVEAQDGRRVVVNWSSVQAVSYAPDAHTRARHTE